MKLLKQLKARRLALGLKQTDMQMRIGMNQQQYQTIETRGNPRLHTLELIAEGLEAELMLIPKHLLPKVEQLVEQEAGETSRSKDRKPSAELNKPDMAEDPWSGLLDD